MQTAREILRETRRKKQISLRTVAEKTKIPLKYLQAVEKGDCASFPGFHYAQLYVRDYAEFLGLSAQKIVSLFRRDWGGDWRQGEREERGHLFRLWEKPFFLSGNTLMAALGIFAVALYLLRQYLVFNSPPPLKVELLCLPGKILVRGKTNPQAVVRVEGKAVLLGGDGKFKEEISLPWPETVTVQAESPTGKIREEAIPTRCSP